MAGKPNLTLQSETTVKKKTILGSNVIASFSGSGGKNTRPFTVPAGWEIQWDAKGSIFQIYLHGQSGDLIGVPANQQGAGKGSSYQAKAGIYFLTVNAMGKWSLKIVKIK